MLTARDRFFADATSNTAGIGLGVEIVSDGPSPPVYNPTTMPLGSTNGLNRNNGNGAGGKTPANSPLDIQAPKLETNYKLLPQKETERFSNLPSREPVDMDFKNLSLTVKLGFRRGK